MLEELELTKEQEEEDKNFDSTDGIIDTIKESVEEFVFSFQNEVENLDIPEGGKIALRTLSKLIAAITDKRYNRLEKIKKVLKVAAKVALEAWQERN